MPAIVQYWHSEDVPTDVKELTATFAEQNPDTPHRLFAEAEAADLIADHFTSRQVEAFRACAVPAMQADYFRCCAILALGGVYADVGLVCRQPLEPLLETAGGGGLLVRLSPGEVISNGFFAFPAPGHPFLRLALELATTNVERRIADSVNRVTGPLVFTCLAEAHRAGRFDTGWAPAPRVARIVEAMYEEIADYERVANAMRGLRIEPSERVRRWLSPARPAYKDSDTRWSEWPNHRGSIFRSAP